jgi:putative hemolysin
VAGLEVVIVLLLILLNGVLAMSEMALVSANRVRLQQRAESGSAGAKTALAIAEDPNRFLSTVQIGITLVGILAGAYGGVALSEPVADAMRDLPLVGNRADSIAFTTVVVLITFLTLVAGELVPKRLALRNAEAISSMVARPMLVASKIAAPLVWLLGASTNLVLKLMRVQEEKEPAITEEEVAILLQQGAIAGVFLDTEREMVMNVFGLDDLIVSEVMTPRVRLVAIDLNDSDEEIEKTIRSNAFQTYPVVDGDLDNIVGVVAATDLWKSLLDGRESLSSAVRPPVYVPETLPVSGLLEQMLRTHAPVAFVVNEYGTVEGLVTIRDVVEEILGVSIGQPTDQPFVLRSDGSWLVDGLVSLHDVEDVIGVETLEAWSADRYQTLGGFMMGELNRIPFVGDVITWNDWQFEVVDMDGNRVDRILVTSLAPVDEDAIAQA